MCGSCLPKNKKKEKKNSNDCAVKDILQYSSDNEH